MYVSGLTANPSRALLFPNTSTTTTRGSRTPCERRVSAFSQNGKCRKNMEFLRLDSKNYWSGIPWGYRSFQQTHKIKSAIDASYGDMADNSIDIFPRINIRDPYKRLGISNEASEAEIQAARTFLISRYSGHKPSIDAIESAHDKIIMQKFHERKRPKLNIKKKVRAFTQSGVMQAVTGRFRTPATNFIIKTASVFVILGVLTVLFPTEEGPTLQVAISLLATVYFINDRLKSKMRALLYGAAAFAISWFLGTFLMVSVIPPILRGPRGLEVTTSLLSYVLLWVASSYLN